MAFDESLRLLGPELEHALATALDVQGSLGAWDAFEMRRGLGDLLALGTGQDACYDSPSVGWAYAGWYHARRVQDAVGMLAPALTSQGRAVSVVDLGSGTGATLWAVAAVTTAARRVGVAVPRVSLVAVDASAPMIETNRWLWSHLANHPTFGAAVAATAVEWRLASWTDIGHIGPADDDRWVVAGHLFDSSDALRLDDVCRSVIAALGAIGAERFFTSTAYSKRHIANSAAEQLAGAGWSSHVLAPVQAWWEGELPRVGSVRYRHYSRAGIIDARTMRVPHWNDHLYGLGLVRTDRGPRLFEPDAGLPFRLDDLQTAAATPDERMTAILGAAGSGKSWVLVERAVRTAEAPAPPGRPHHILVTTFNQEMIHQLSAWLGDRLQASSLASLQLSRPHKMHRWSDPGVFGRPSITLVHIDKLAYDAARRWVDLDGPWKEKMAAHLETSGIWMRATTDPQREVLDPAYLLEEARTVIRGRDVDCLETYRRSRSGRRRPLSPEQTELIWDALSHPGAPHGFPELRLSWTHALRRRHHDGHDPAYTHLFVDECQDMTESDFEAFTYLVPDPQRIVVAGDEAQSVKLGSAYHRPRQVNIPPKYRPDGPAFRLWQEHHLSGSYRLPVRLCEAIQPIAERIRADRGLDPRDDSDAELPISTKAAVLGRRPIVVAASNAATALPQVWDELSPHLELVAQPDRRMTEAEQTTFLPTPAGWTREARTMLDIKGLERDLMIWKTSAPIPAGEPLLSWIYTILTRSRSMLVIVADPDGTEPEVAGGLALLRRDRLLPWDQMADDAWTRLTTPPSGVPAS